MHAKYAHSANAIPMQCKVCLPLVYESDVATALCKEGLLVGSLLLLWTGAGEG